MVAKLARDINLRTVANLCRLLEFQCRPDVTDERDVRFSRTGDERGRSVAAYRHGNEPPHTSDTTPGSGDFK
ncbi:hypothetical protein DPEC_G00322360 [Dallia pectoralis]|uniref:Uncharacterized protein n=1 Tax=Dallia pectoralis TaxID=75939 RepID=A0ACC2FAG2_DALPE|nr:hypothetical protein DPEC_G00322360 [Dallia pectoralis]